MSKKEEISKETLVEQYFEKNKEEKNIYVTSDNFLFQQHKHALDHANTLEDSKRVVETFTNPLRIKVDVQEVSGTNEGLSDAEKQLLATELTKSNYNEMKSLVKALNIDVVDAKAETLITALEDHKTKLQN